MFTLQKIRLPVIVVIVALGLSFGVKIMRASALELPVASFVIAQADAAPPAADAPPKCDTAKERAKDRSCLASDCKPGEGQPLNKENCGIVKWAVMATRALSALVGIVVVIMVVVGGIQYSASRDNPQATAAAKGRIVNALLALFIYLFMFSFLQWAIPGGIF